MSDLIDHCPYGYSDRQAWCDWRNGQMGRNDVRWVVAANGVPTLEYTRAFTEALTANLDRTNETERQRFNHRQRNPIA